MTSHPVVSHLRWGRDQLSIQQQAWITFSVTSQWISIYHEMTKLTPFLIYSIQLNTCLFHDWHDNITNSQQILCTPKWTGSCNETHKIPNPESIIWKFEYFLITEIASCLVKHCRHYIERIFLKFWMWRQIPLHVLIIFKALC